MKRQIMRSEETNERKESSKNKFKSRKLEIYLVTNYVIELYKYRHLKMEFIVTFIDKLRLNNNLRDRNKF